MNNKLWLPKKSEENPLDKYRTTSSHNGGKRVNLKTPYNKEDYITFFETGEIKG